MLFGNAVTNAGGKETLLGYTVDINFGDENQNWAIDRWPGACVFPFCVLNARGQPHATGYYSRLGPRV